MEKEDGEKKINERKRGRGERKCFEIIFWFSGFQKSEFIVLSGFSKKKLFIKRFRSYFKFLVNMVL